MHVLAYLHVIIVSCAYDKEISYFFCRDAYQGALSEEEMASLEQAARDKSNALALIEDREREIRAIRDGQITSKRVSQC